MTDQSLTTTRGGHEIMLARQLEAPIDVTWRAWTRPEHFAEWFGPHGSTIEPFTLETRQGGRLHFCHRVPEVGDVWVKGVFEEVVEQERLVFAVSFSDADGNDVERPGLPLQMRTIVTFADEGSGTRITIHQTGLERGQGESQGWEESMQRLARLLGRLGPQATGVRA
jgi:uncharacterized protein YndB with AHSA1/START domain